MIFSTPFLSIADFYQKGCIDPCSFRYEIAEGKHPLCHRAKQMKYLGPLNTAVICGSWKRLHVTHRGNRDGIVLSLQITVDLLHTIPSGSIAPRYGSNGTTAQVVRHALIAFKAATAHRPSQTRVDAGAKIADGLVTHRRLLS